MVAYEDKLNTYSSGENTVDTTIYLGARIKAKYNLNLLWVSKHPWCTATKCSIFSDSYSLIATATFVNNKATFNLNLAADTYYRVQGHSDGNPYTCIYVQSGTYPKNGYNINYVAFAEGSHLHTFSHYVILSIASQEVPPPTDPTGLTLAPTYLYINQTLTATGSGSDSNYRYRFDNYTDNIILQDYSDTATYVPTSATGNKTIRVYTKGWNGAVYSTNAYTSDILVRVPKQKLRFGTADKSIVVGS